MPEIKSASNHDAGHSNTAAHEDRCEAPLSPQTPTATEDQAATTRSKIVGASRLRTAGREVIEAGKRKGDRDFDSAERRCVSYLMQHVPVVGELFDENISLVGEGGFGAVFKAQPLDSSRFRGLKYVAIKLFYPIKSAPLDRLREIEWLITLNADGCPNVPTVLDVIIDDDHYLLVMNYVDHDSFKSYSKTLSLSELSAYLKGLLLALSGLRRRNLVHRDVKPENFLFHRKSRTCCLVDFGLAHHGSKPSSSRVKENSRASAQCGESGSQVYTVAREKPLPKVYAGGTRGYRPPEVLLRSQKPQTTSVDMWGAGTVLLGLLARRPGFFSGDDHEHLAQLCELLGPVYLSQVAYQSLAIQINCPDWSRDTDNGLGTTCKLTAIQKDSTFRASADQDDNAKGSAQCAVHMGYSLKDLCETFCRVDREANESRHKRRKISAENHSPHTADREEKEVESSQSCERAVATQTWPDEIYDLLGRMLHPDPDLRITPEAALRHPFFSLAPDDSEEALT